MFNTNKINVGIIVADILNSSLNLLYVVINPITTGVKNTNNNLGIWLANSPFVPICKAILLGKFLNKIRFIAKHINNNAIFILVCFSRLKFLV